jgi:hypothetical protein
VRAGRLELPRPLGQQMLSFPSHAVECEEYSSKSAPFRLSHITLPHVAAHGFTIKSGTERDDRFEVEDDRSLAKVAHARSRHPGTGASDPAPWRAARPLFHAAPHHRRQADGGGVGMASEGWTLKRAQEELGKLIQAHRRGPGDVARADGGRRATPSRPAGCHRRRSVEALCR